MASTSQQTRTPPADRGLTGAGAPPAGYRPPYLAAALATLGVWLLYVVTLSPTTWFWDTSEYIATAHILGVPHPPGNPTFVVLARAWELLLAPFGLSVAVRINLFSATMSALAHGFWFLMVHRILSFWGRGRAFALVGAAAAVVISATAFTVWNQSNVNEKVYTVSLFTIGLLSWLAFRWRDNLGRGKDDNLILLMVFILALSVGNHLMAFLAAPALLVLILLVAPRTLMNWKLYAFGSIVALIGVSIHLYLPLRAALDPIINEADPSTMGALWESLTRKQYDKPSVFANPTDLSLPRDIGLIIAQLGNYLQYFDWQWARSVMGTDTLFPLPRTLVTFGFAVLGIYGAREHAQRDRISFWYVLVLFLTLSVALVGYLNFKYGYTYPEPGGGITNAELHEVRERDYFFIVSFSLWGLWTGVGLAALWGRLGDALRGRLRRPERAHAFAAPLLVLALIPLALNWGWASRRDDWSARDWAYNLLMSVEPYGVLFTNGDNDTFPLWYLQEVEGIRRDVTVLVMSYLNTPWYVKQVKRLTSPCAPGVDPLEDPSRIICQRPYDPAVGPSIYRVEARPADAAAEPVQVGDVSYPPTRSIIQMSDSQIDSLPLQYAANPYDFLIQQPMRVQAGELTWQLPAGQVLLPADVFMLHIIQNALGDRPIYYATTTQAYARVGLDRFLVRKGVAMELHEGPVPANERPDIVALPGNVSIAGPFIDLPVTDTLLWNVFVHRGGIPDEWDYWVDPATTNIPFYYAYAHYAAGIAHSLLEEDEAAERHAERFEAWVRLGQQ